jgi:PST family polysaccharide transporter
MSLRRFRAPLLPSGLVRNALGLYAVQVGTYAVPIATIVLLAHRLGPQSWGSLAFMQAFASYVVFLVNYGFSASAVREVARHRDDRERLADVVAGVLGVKVMLAVASLLIVIPVSMLVPAVHRHDGLLWPAMLWALSLSFSFSWFYQGLERMGLVACCETTARFLSLAAILVVVRSPNDTWKVFVVQGGLLWVALLIELVAAWRRVGLRLPTLPLIGQTFRMGWTMFLLSGALSFYTIGNGFILGLFGSSVVVGYYAGAERISKAFSTLLNPITQAVYPRTSHLALTARAEAARLARTSLFLMGTAGCIAGIIIFLSAPVLVPVLLGPRFEAAVIVLRILALLPPLIAVSNVLGIQWMLALDLDREMNIVILSAGLLNVLLAFALAPRLLHVGMAIAVVASEALVTAGMYAILRIKHLDPITLGQLPSPLRGKVGVGGGVA